MFEDEYGFSGMLVPRKQTGLCVFVSCFFQNQQSAQGFADVEQKIVLCAPAFPPIWTPNSVYEGGVISILHSRVL